MSTYLGSSRTPRHQDELFPHKALQRALTLVGVLEVDQAVSALARPTPLDVFEKLIVVSVTVADHLHVDLLVIANVENHVAVLLVLSDRLEGGQADV